MAKDRGLDNSELFVYLNENGIAYDPSVETFRDFVKRLGIKSTIYNKETRYLKTDVDLVIKKVGKVNE